MKRLLVVLLLLVIAVAGLGFYRGWFHFSSDQTDQKTNINLTVDKETIRQDEKKAQEQLREAVHQVKQSTSGEKKD